MMRRNFYVVLGVPRKESPPGIRRAFRELAFRYHPDRAGDQSTPFFQEIVAAYNVLSDPAARASYDEGLRHAEGREALRAPITLTVSRSVAEPMVPVRQGAMRGAEVMRSSASDLFRRVHQSFASPRTTAGRRLETIDLEVVLSASDAAQGGSLEVAVPAFYPCRVCRGAQLVASFACYVCDGLGMVKEDELVRVTVPPLVRDGTVLQIPLRGLGIHNIYLRLLIRVGE